MTELVIHRLSSGGLITNYHCTSRCGHCLYHCGPGREKAFITGEGAAAAFRVIRTMGCASVHIGGGEPMLNQEGLLTVLETARRENIRIDYVETNSSWFTGPETAADILTRLRKAGLEAMLVSISPFHNTHIPLARVKGVMAACRETGIRAIPWIPQFLRDLSRFDESIPHSWDDFQDTFGAGYLRSVLDHYWIHTGGRALDTFRPVLPGLTADQIRLKYARSCRTDLSDTSHFHVDLYGNYVPGLCAGLAFPASLLGGPVSETQFPVLTRLWQEGIRGLLEWAETRHGFLPRREAYINKCDLCNDIRLFLAESGAGPFPELSPAGYYDDK